MTNITGLLSSSSDGLTMDLYSGLPQVSDPAERVPLKEGYELEVIDSPHRPQHLAGAVGYAILQPCFEDGEYDGYYGVNANLQGYGLASNSVRVLVRRVMEQDVQFRAVNFIISGTNFRSIRLAKSLGAVRTHGNNDMKYILTADGFRASPIPGAASA